MPGGLATAYGWLDEAIAEGAEIVTAGRRLARELRQAHAERQLATGALAWHTPRILPWDAWLNARVEVCGDAATFPQRLAAQAAAVLWERCLERAAGLDGIDAAGLVPQAERAWRRLNDWCVEVRELARLAATDDERRFARAAADYARTLESRGWVDPAGLAALVAEALADGRLPAPRRLVLAGFERVTPAARRVIDALAAQGCRVTEPPARTPAAATRVLRSADADAELRAAGAWARQVLNENPAARVAIVWPGLEQDAHRAAALVREGFVPGWQAGGPAHAESVQVSYGRPLAAYPLIAAALLWLRWTSQPLTVREVSVLLRAPSPGDPARDGLCRLELELRRFPERRWSAAGVLAMLRGRDDGADALAWLERVARVAACRHREAPRDTPAAWAGRMHDLLEAVGWPGARPLDSAEFQLVNRWRELMNELARIEPVRPRLGFTEALTRLARAASRTVFQPESGPGRVRLLGTLEALGLELDHVWIGNLHALQWPPPAHPLPLVARALQRRAGMPDATPADTLAFAKRTLASLAAAAPAVVLSWPAAEGDRPHAPSPLLAAYASATPEKAFDPGWYAGAFAGAVQHGAVRDPVPRVRPDERIGGGAYTVREQAREPFSAFARRRLGARELERISPGLAPKRRGQIVHAALKQLLSERPTSAAIASWNPVQRGARIAASLTAALAPHERHADAVLRSLLALERERVAALLAACLETETARRPFAVDSVETELGFVAHGVRLGLRADRVDRLPDGSLFVIDYKTGAEERLLDRHGELVDLQLAVYAAALAEPVGGLAIVQVAGPAVRWRAVGAAVDQDPLEPAAWAELLSRWRRRVDAAVEAFAAGDVRVNVASPADEARPLGLLSRVEELRREP